MQTASNGIKDAGARQRTGRVPALRVAAATAASTVVAAGAVWALWLAWRSAFAGVAAEGPASAAELLSLAVATAALAALVWLALGAVLELVSHVPGRLGRAAGRWADRLTPALARRVAAFVLGVGVGVAGGPGQAVAGPRAPASSATADLAAAPRAEAPLSAAPDPSFAAASTRPAVPAVVRDPGFAPAPGNPAFSPAPNAPAGTRASTSTPPTPGFVPTAPTVRPQADPRLLGARSARHREDADVVVHRGDSLWSIAARHLGPDADDAEVALAWPRWFEANRGVIGDDPDHLLPGQVLRVPTSDPSGAR